MSMTTTKQLLPAINSLYKIELTDTMLDNLCNTMDNLTTTCVNEKFTEDVENPLTSMKTLEKDNIEELLEHVFYVTRKNNIIVGSSIKQHQNQTIELKKIYTDDEKELSMYDEFLKEGESKYVVSFGHVSRLAVGRHFAWFDTLSTDDISMLSTIRYIVAKLYDSDGSFDTTMGHTIIEHATLGRITAKGWKKWDSVESMCIAFREDMLKDYDKLNRSFKAQEESIANITKVFKGIFPEALVTKKGIEKDVVQSLHNDGHRRFIMTVLEVENHRISFIVKSSQSYYRDQSTLEAKMFITPHTSEMYNYVDAGRQTYKTKSSRYGEEFRPFGEIFFIADEPLIPRRIILTDYLRSNTNLNFLDNQQLTLISKRYLQKQKRISSEQEAKDRLEKKIESKISAIGVKGKDLKINDVVYSSEQIDYQGQILKVNSMPGWVKALLGYQTRAYSLDSITFDQIFGAFVSQTEVLYSDQYSVSVPSVKFAKGVVGNVSFDITTQSTTNVNDVTSYRFYVNGYRVNAKEVHKCIERAICFETQSDYNYFLKSVSSCSLKIHRYLQLGIDIRVRDYFDNTEVVLKFPIERNKNLNYLVLNDNEYRIRNTDKILRLEKVDTIMDVINTLLGGQTIEGINAEDVRDVIDAGKQAFIDAIAKSKELLEHCEKVLDVKQELLTLKDGAEFMGYKIKGEYRTYAVNATDDRYSVYDIDTAQYICIVDKSNGAQAGLDRLVNRLFALHNDSRVATQISTLKPIRSNQ
jgi:hypothetical protein